MCWVRYMVDTSRSVIWGHVPPKSYRLWRNHPRLQLHPVPGPTGTISKTAAKRLKWIDYFRSCENKRLTCRHFGISPTTFAKWINRFDPYDLTTLEDEPKRPHHVRQSQTPQAIVDKVQALRERYPRWGKEKLAVVLRREGIRISGSTVGRVMDRLRARGLLGGTREHPPGQDGPETPPESPLCGPQAEGLPGLPARRSG